MSAETVARNLGVTHFSGFDQGPGLSEAATVHIAITRGRHLDLQSLTLSVIYLYPQENLQIPLHGVKTPSPLFWPNNSDLSLGATSPPPPLCSSVWQTRRFGSTGAPLTPSLGICCPSLSGIGFPCPSGINLHIPAPQKPAILTHNWNVPSVCSGGALFYIRHGTCGAEWKLPAHPSVQFTAGDCPGLA